MWQISFQNKKFHYHLQQYQHLMVRLHKAQNFSIFNINKQSIVMKRLREYLHVLMKNKIFCSFFEVNLSSKEKAIGIDSIKNKYISTSIKAFQSLFFIIPSLFFLPSDALSTILISVTMVSGTAWFSISLSTIKKKFEPFGIELTTDILQAFIMSLLILLFLGVVQLGKPFWGSFLPDGNILFFLQVVSYLLGVYSIACMIYWLYIGAIKYDLNDAMLAGQNEAAELYFKKSLSVLINASNQLKRSTNAAVSNYYTGLAFSHIFNFGLKTKGYVQVFEEQKIAAENIRKEPILSLEKSTKIIVLMTETFLEYCKNIHSQTAKEAHGTIVNEYLAMKQKKDSIQIRNIRIAIILESIATMLELQGETLFTKRLEIERKFLVKNVPKNLHMYEHKEIQQGYISSENHDELRVRKIGNMYYRTIKNTIDIQKNIREEEETILSIEEFKALWTQTANAQIYKTRYYIPYKEKIIELDIFKAANQGLILAEIETITVEKDIILPTWFGKEVTNNAKYKNKNLAR